MKKLERFFVCISLCLVLILSNTMWIFASDINVVETSYNSIDTYIGTGESLIKANFIFDEINHYAFKAPKDGIYTLYFYDLETFDNDGSMLKLNFKNFNKFDKDFTSLSKDYYNRSLNSMRLYSNNYCELRYKNLHDDLNAFGNVDFSTWRDNIEKYGSEIIDATFEMKRGEKVYVFMDRPIDERYNFLNSCDYKVRVRKVN